MAAFHVFVEGATDDTPAGVARLAEAIGKHYGLPAPDLLARLQRGRFRVKGNIDRTVAEQYCRDLERLGARCVIEEATPQNSQRSTPLPFPAVRPATPPAGVPAAPSRPSAPPSALAGIAPSRPSAPPSALAGMEPSRPATPPSGTQQYQSGLAAAFSGEAPAASLGALEQESLSFSLASVDGGDEPAAPAAAAFAPPAASLSASIGPPPETAAKPAKRDKPKDVPLDLFAPPDAQDAELKVDIASDEIEESARRRPSTPVVGEEPAPRTSSAQLSSAAEPPARRSQPALQADVAVARSSKLGPLGDERVRFVAGVVLAILIGFVPAHVVAAAREKSAYKAIDTKVMAVQQLADTPEAYAALDKMRADQLARKEGEQRNAAIIALAIWALVGGAVAFGWFKKIPWDRFE
jgi:hypothetical protein